LRHNNTLVTGVKRDIDLLKQIDAPLNLSQAQLAQLEELGTLLNYNGYGATVDDLFFAPDALFKKLLPYSDPFEFINSDDTFKELKTGYESDMANAKAIEASFANDAPSSTDAT